MAPAELVNRAIKRVDYRMPEIFDALIDRACASGVCPSCGAPVPGYQSDRDAAIYLIDRRLGRPRQEIDARVSAQIQMLPEDYARLAMLQAAIGVVASVPLGQLSPAVGEDAIDMDYTDELDSSPPDGPKDAVEDGQSPTGSPLSEAEIGLDRFGKRSFTATIAPVP